jgi:hypothetical protein
MNVLIFVIQKTLAFLKGLCMDKENELTDPVPDHLGTCALCDAENVVLKESHSIPKFVYDWLKETSKTPYIRSIDDVNSRKQDGPKEYLLCGKCERELSSLEKTFSEKIFKKIANYQKQAQKIIVTEAHRICLLSIFWRALLTTKERPNGRSAEDEKIYDAFLAEMKSQIKMKRCSYEVCILPFWGDPPYYGLNSDMTYMLERSIGGQDIRFFDEPHRYYSIFCLPFMCFYIFSSQWSAEEIEGSTQLVAGDLALNKIDKVPNHIRWYLESHYDQYSQSLSNINTTNLAQIKADVKKNNNVTGSDKSIKRSKLNGEDE